MKKIGIITICDYNNYGNRLQNYATQEVLKSIGFETETIVNMPDNKISALELLNKTRHKNLLTLIIKFFQKIRRKFFKNNEEKKYAVLNKKRTLAFKKFTNENIKETNYTINRDNIPSDLGERYDYFITGSDQVWNPFFRNGFSVDFLTFAPRHKRISYSASFGVSSLPEEYKEDYRLWLSQMEHISVREDAGANIVKDLTGMEVHVLIDPTLMLTKEKWLTVAKSSKFKPVNSYLLTYFLGETTVELNEKIEEIARNRELEIIHLANVEDEKRYIADPSEFLDYINSSEIFFTDSFHGVVFSILFEKPFVIFDRISDTQSMNSRIDTLLSKFKLENRKWESIKNSNDIFNINFSHVLPIIKAERVKTLNYLKNALDIKDADGL